jgi:nitrous oxide reductase accessory protein NosL
MNSNAAAFASKQAAEQTAKETAGTVKSWNDLYQYL